MYASVRRRQGAREMGKQSNSETVSPINPLWRPGAECCASARRHLIYKYGARVSPYASIRVINNANNARALFEIFQCRIYRRDAIDAVERITGDAGVAARPSTCRGVRQESARRFTVSPCLFSLLSRFGASASIPDIPDRSSPRRGRRARYVCQKLVYI